MPAEGDAVLAANYQDTGGRQPAPKVYLKDYDPTSTSGDWHYSDIPQDDFTGHSVALDLDNILYLGFWNPVSSNRP